MSPSTDSELLERAARGDQEALGELLEKHQSRVFRFGMQMCRNQEDAKDVLQETLLAMARSVHDFRGGSSVSTWIYSIARNFCAKRRRKGKFDPQRQESFDEAGADADLIADPGCAPDEQMANLEIGAALRQAIGMLEPDYREVLVLRDVEGLSAVEVAKVLGLKVPAVKSRLHRARLAVRDTLAPLLGDGADAAARPASCPDVLLAFSQNLEGDLTAGTCAQMEQHIASCSKCRGVCDSLKQVLTLCQATPEPELSPEVQRAVKDALSVCLRPGITAPR